MGHGQKETGNHCSRASHPPIPSPARSLSLDLSSIPVLRALPPIAHSIPHQPSTQPTSKHPLHQCSHFRLISGGPPSSGTPLLPAPRQGRVAFWAPPDCLSFCPIQPLGARGREGARQTKFENKLKFWTRSRERPVGSTVQSLTWDPARPEATWIPSAWPPPFRVLPGASAHACTGRHPPALPPRSSRVGPSGTPDLPRGALTVLGSPVPSAGSQTPGRYNPQNTQGFQSRSEMLTPERDTRHSVRPGVSHSPQPRQKDLRPFRVSLDSHGGTLSP